MYLGRFLFILILLGISLSLLSVVYTSLTAQDTCPEGSVCIEGEQPVPDIGPLPDTVRIAFGAKEELGKLLFCDHRLASDDKYACAQCHNPLFGFTEHRKLPTGVGGLAAGVRNSPTIYNVGYNSSLPNAVLLWDGRVRSLEEHLANIKISPIKGHTEMNMVNASNIMKKLGNLPAGRPEDPDSKKYRKKFREAFPSSGRTFANLVKAIVAYERTIISVDSPFDQYMVKFKGVHPEGMNQYILTFQRAQPAGGLPPFEDLGISNFGSAEWQGMLLFRGKSRCILCHYGPNFTDNKFHNVGWPAKPQPGGAWSYNLNLNDESQDLGRYLALVRILNKPAKPSDRGAFKTPTLRQLTDTWPYMHDGGIPTNWDDLTEDKRFDAALKEIVDFFSSGGAGNLQLDPLLKSLSLTEGEEGEKTQLRAFLKSLTGKPLEPKLVENCPFPPR